MEQKTEKSGRPTKKGGYSFKKQLNKRAQKRVEAENRNKLWQNLSPQEQIALLKTRRGDSKRQVERLNKVINKVNKK